MKKINNLFSVSVSKFKGFFGRYTALCCLITAFLLEIYIESFARLSVIDFFIFMFKRPVVFLMNVLIIAVLLLLCLFVKKSFALYATFSIVWIAIGTTNGIVLLNRPFPFTLSDFLILPSVIGIITVYLKVWQIIIIALAIVAAIVGLVFLWKKCDKRPLSLKRDIPKFISAAVLLATLIPVSFLSGWISKDYSDMKTAFNNYGFPYSFSTTVFLRGVQKPTGYDKPDIDDLLEQLKTKRSENEKEEIHPNIIYVQLESFFDVNYLKDITFSENPCPNFTALKKDYPSGFLSVPHIGGGTANTEFEVLTGMNIEHFSAGEYPYIISLENTFCESIASVLKTRGYSTSAMHNNTGTFYSRHLVYPNLSFDKFIPIEFMYNVEVTSVGWAKDKIMLPEIDQCLTSTPGRDFVFTVSVQPHGVYPNYPTGGSLSVEGVEDEELHNMYSYYINQIYETDALIGELVSKYSESEEPTVIVFYGDHLPDLQLTEDSLSKGNLYQTEYVIWSNFELSSDKDSPDLEAYQLSAYLLKLLGIDDGLAFGIHNYFSDKNNYDYLMNLAEYDALFGERYYYSTRPDYRSSDMIFGNSEISVYRAEISDSKLKVTGKGFNRYSVVYVNNKKYDTVYISETELWIENFKERADKIYYVSVNQESEHGYAFYTSNNVTADSSP